MNGERREIFKDPVTDNGTKKSLKGLVKVVKENGKYVCFDQVNEVAEREGKLRTVFKDSVLYNEDYFSNIRRRISEQLTK